MFAKGSPPSCTARGGAPHLQSPPRACRNEQGLLPTSVCRPFCMVSSARAAHHRPRHPAQSLNRSLFLGQVNKARKHRPAGQGTEAGHQQGQGHHPVWRQTARVRVLALPPATWASHLPARTRTLVLKTEIEMKEEGQGGGGKMGGSSETNNLTSPMNPRVP